MRSRNSNLRSWADGGIRLWGVPVQVLPSISAMTMGDLASQLGIGGVIWVSFVVFGECTIWLYTAPVLVSAEIWIIAL
jgi:hypothetical protein